VQGDHVVTERARQWIDTHPETALLRRCWDNDPKYRRTAQPNEQDSEALSEWVRTTVRDSPRSIPWHDWPPRFVVLEPTSGSQPTMFKRV